MRILALSDILWGSFPAQQLNRLVASVRPAVVLIAGDLVDKGGNQEEYWLLVDRFFRMLNDSRIPTMYVRGNWDTSPWYERIQSNSLEFVQEISGRSVNVEGMSVLGIPYWMTHDLKTARGLSGLAKGSVDIVLAHAENTRRVWLLQLSSRAVITGHYDEQVCQIGETLLVSMWNYPRHYTVLNWNPDSIFISFRDRSGGRMKRREAESRNGELTWKKNRFRSHRAECRRLESLLDARMRMLEGSRSRKQLEEELAALKVPKRHIREFLAISR